MNAFVNKLLPRSVIQYWPLFYAMTKRDIQERYRGSFLGLFWSILNPVLLLLVYGFVFGVIFKAKWPVVNGVNSNFSVLLFCGLVTHMLFADVLTRSAQLIVGNANYVKKVVFPLGLFSGILTFSAGFHFVVSFSIAWIYALYSGAILSWVILWFPIIFLMFCFFLVGVSWIVSALGVYFRDVTYVTAFIATAMMFLSPIFYPASSVPGSFSAVMKLNPLTYYVETFRGIAVYGQAPSVRASLIALFIAVIFFVLGRLFFNRVKRGFADVL